MYPALVRYHRPLRQPRVNVAGSHTCTAVAILSKYNEETNI
jgi:hypothetical protein